MALIRLKKLLKHDVISIINAMSQAFGTSVAVQDADGKYVLEHGDESFSLRYPIELEDGILGWVLGNDEQIASVATLLSHLAYREYEKKMLSVETLERYKEINLLYTISQKMASCLSPEEVAQLAIQEVLKLIKGNSASVMLLNEDTNVLEFIAVSGMASSSTLLLHAGEGIAGHVVFAGKGVILNDVHSAPDFIEDAHQISSMICVPLQVEDKTFGVMNISSQEPVLYTAGDLKLATALATQAAVSIENARLHAEQLEQERIVKELEIAREIQQTLLPDSTPEIAGIDVAGMSLPAKEVGGDFYDFIPGSEQHLGVVIADVSGKGVPAALFMALSRALMRANSLHDTQVAQAVMQTNRLILECTTSGLFVTLFYGIVNTEQRTFRYVSGGHNPPMLFRNATGTIEMLEADGIALGVLDEIELEEKEISLETDDIMVLYTDGVTESINSHEEEFGEERLCQLIQEHHALSANELIHKIEKTVMDFTEDEPQFDDFTLLVVKMI